MTLVRSSYFSSKHLHSRPVTHCFFFIGMVRQLTALSSHVSRQGPRVLYSGVDNRNSRGDNDELLTSNRLAPTTCVASENRSRALGQ